MHPHRVSRQVEYLLNMPPVERKRTLLGTTFDRDPPDSTWHYSDWANGLTDERLLLDLRCIEGNRLAALGTIHLIMDGIGQGLTAGTIRAENASGHGAGFHATVVHP